MNQHETQNKVLKTKIARICRLETVGMIGSCRQHLRKLGKLIQLCPDCDGRGKIYEPEPHPWGDEGGTTETCKRCEGKGWLNGQT